MSVEIVSTILSYVVSWPVAILVGLVLFRGPISNLIERATRLNIGPAGAGLEAAAVRAEQQAEASRPPETPVLPPQAGGAVLQQPEPSPLYDAFDTPLRDRLDQVFGDKTDLKLTWAIRQHSITLIERVHETNYRVMYTAQIWALKQLNTVGGQARLKDGLRLYEEAARQNPSFYGNITWESWSGFLLATGYVETVGQIAGEGSDPLVRLTPLGKNFLLWVTGRGVPEIKAY
jgi:hypothetical protein